MSSSIQGKKPYVFAQADSQRALAIAVSNSLHFHAATPSSRERVAFPLRLPPVHSPHIHPTRVTVLHPFQRKDSRASSPYPFERGIVKLRSSLKRKVFAPVFQSYTYTPHVPTSNGLVTGQLFGLIPFDPARVKTAATPTLLQLPILPLNPLQKGEFEALKEFYETAKTLGIPFDDQIKIGELILDLLQPLEIDDTKRAQLTHTLSRFAAVHSILSTAPTINMDLGESEHLILGAIHKISESTDLSKLHSVELYAWIVTKIQALKIPEKEHLSIYLCCKRYVYNKTYRPKITSQIPAPVEPVSIEQSIMQDLARERDHPLLGQGDG